MRMCACIMKYIHIFIQPCSNNINQRARVHLSKSEYIYIYIDGAIFYYHGLLYCEINTNRIIAIFGRDIFHFEI